MKVGFLRSLTLLSALAGVAILARGLAAEEPSTLGAREAIRRDHEASMRYLAVLMERERRILKRGSEAQAIRAEAECLRHEIKCLDRCLWYVRHDRSLASKAPALAAAIVQLRNKDPKASLEERRKNGFKVADAVADPLGISPVAVLGKDVHASSPVAVHARTEVDEIEPEPPVAAPPRREPVKPPPETPPAGDDAGSAGSPGMGGH